MNRSSLILLDRIVRIPPYKNIVYIHRVNEKAEFSMSGETNSSPRDYCVLLMGQWPHQGSVVSIVTG